MVDHLPPPCPDQPLVLPPSSATFFFPPFLPSLSLTSRKRGSDRVRVAILAFARLWSSWGPRRHGLDEVCREHGQAGGASYPVGVVLQVLGCRTVVYVDAPSVAPAAAGIPRQVYAGAPFVHCFFATRVRVFRRRRRRSDLLVQHLNRVRARWHHAGSFPLLCCR